MLYNYRDSCNCMAGLAAMPANRYGAPSGVRVPPCLRPFSLPLKHAQTNLYHVASIYHLSSSSTQSHLLRRR